MPVALVCFPDTDEKVSEIQHIGVKYYKVLFKQIHPVVLQ